MSQGLWPRCLPSVPINRASLHDLGLNGAMKTIKTQSKHYLLKVHASSSSEIRVLEKFISLTLPLRGRVAMTAKAGNNLNVQQKKTGYISHDGPIRWDMG